MDDLFYTLCIVSYKISHHHRNQKLDVLLFECKSYAIRYALFVVSAQVLFNSAEQVMVAFNPSAAGESKKLVSKAKRPFKVMWDG